MLKNSLVVLLGLAMLVLLVVSLSLIKTGMQQQINFEVETRLDSIQHVLESELAKDAKILHALLDVIKDDSRLRRAWAMSDKETLLKIASQIFRSMRTDHRITHFYFHTRDSVNFLRVHNPSRSGDLITRHTMKAAVETGKVAHGIELGPFGTFTLRVVLPWEINGEVVGYLELGEEIEHITPRLKQLLGVDFIFAIDKEFVDRADWEVGLKMLHHAGDWNQFKDFVLINKTLPSLPEGLPEELIRKYRHNNSFFEVADGAESYGVRIFPSKDVSGKEVGLIISLYDITAQKAAMKKMLWLQFFAVVTVFTGLFFFLGLSLRKYRLKDIS